MCNTSKGCTLQARKPAEQQNWQSATVSESGQGSGHSLVVGHKTTWNHPNSVYPRVGSPLELPDQKSFMHSPWHACFIRCFRSSSKWRNGNLFSSKVLRTTAGTLPKSVSRNRRNDKIPFRDRDTDTGIIWIVTPCLSPGDDDYPWWQICSQSAQDERDSRLQGSCRKNLQNRSKQVRTSSSSPLWSS